MTRRNAKENNDMRTFCEIMNVDTKLFTKELEKLPEDERERFLEDARQSAKEQQRRLKKYLKQLNLKEVYIVKCPICKNCFSGYTKDRYSFDTMKVKYYCKNCNKEFYGFENTEKILLWDNDNYSLFSKEQYKIDKV